MQVPVRVPSDSEVHVGELQPSGHTRFADLPDHQAVPLKVCHAQLALAGHRSLRSLARGLAKKSVRVRGRSGL